VIEVGGSGRSSATVADWSAGLETCGVDAGGTRTVSSATGAVGGAGLGSFPYGSAPNESFGTDPTSPAGVP